MGVESGYVDWADYSAPKFDMQSAIDSGSKTTLDLLALITNARNERERRKIMKDQLAEDKRQFDISSKQSDRGLNLKATDYLTSSVDNARTRASKTGTMGFGRALAKAVGGQ